MLGGVPESAQLALEDEQRRLGQLLVDRELLDTIYLSTSEREWLWSTEGISWRWGMPDYGGLEGHACGLLDHQVSPR